MENETASEMHLSPNALSVLERRYVRRGADGAPVESVAGVFWRVARHVAGVEAQWNGDVESVARRFFDLTAGLRFLPNSPTFTGAGTPLGQLAACFVLPISDDMGRASDGIFQTLRDAALVQQTGGGNGFSFSHLRPKGALVRSSGGKATGPVGFLRVFDTASGIVSQGGARRGANMAVLRVDHPDIEEFIACKQDEQSITHFNISVGMTDAFMEALARDEAVALVNPQDGQTWRTVRAREVFDRIIDGAFRNGEPGMLFLDAANRDNPCPHLGNYETTNPCVVGTTWVVTEKGPLQVADMVGEMTRLLVNGEFQSTTPKGFFSTGTQDVYAVRTQRGFSVAVTLDHPLLVATRVTPRTVETEWRPVRSLGVGDRVLLGEHGDACWEGRGNWEEGYLLGLLVGDGTITIGKAVLSVWGTDAETESIRRKVEQIVSKLPGRADFRGFVSVPERREFRLTLKVVYELAVSYGLSESVKTITPQIERTGSRFHCGFLCGLFDADGTVIGNQDKGISVRLAQSDLEMLQAAQRMLHRLGVVSTLYTERRAAGRRLLPDGKGGMKEYDYKAQHELAISKDNLVRFSDRIGFIHAEKASRLADRLSVYRRRINRERFVDTVVAIEKMGKSPVYDVQVPGSHAFDANGFFVHNCGEQFLLPYENCCLGSINLAQHVRVSDDAPPALDWEGLRETTKLAVRFLDDVVEANAYVPAVPQLKEAALRTRRIGLGIMGLGDALIQLRVRYGSPAGQELAAQMMEFIRYHAMLASIDLAQQRGAFPAIAGSVYDPARVTWTPPQPLVPYERLDAWGRPPLDWNAVLDGLRRHGIRNAAQTTVAPTGTTATVASVEAYGCEPIFALAYTRRMKDDGQDVELDYVSPLFLRALEQAGLAPAVRERAVRQVLVTGSCQGIEAVPAALRDVFVVSGDISVEEHVRMQATLQAFVDASISKTVNFPAGATREDVARAFELAWRLGCKGLTVYVTGSREQVVLETEETRRAKSDPSAATLIRRPRPDALDGRTYRLRTPLGTAYITINVDGDGEPFEVFLNVGKAGSDTAAVSEAIGRLISYALRIPSPLSPAERTQQVADQLKGIGGGRPLGFGRARVWSLPDGVAQILEEHLGRIDPADNTEAQQQPPFSAGDLCPECGHATLINEEGCRHCYSCGYSEC
ncbi:MAG: ribonucleoside reductase class II [Anaerolineae bacterium]|nr:ribonucleoside reductase class II [Anaerolineae bacterium]